MPANPERGEVDLVVGDRALVLSLTTNDLCVIQARTGKTYGDLVVGLSRLDVPAIRDLLWTALQRYHAAEFKKVEDVGALMDSMGGFLEALPALRTLAIVNQKPGLKAGEKPDFLMASPGISAPS